MPLVTELAFEEDAIGTEILPQEMCGRGVEALARKCATVRRAVIRD